MNLDEMCAQALKRISQYIERSVAQHLHQIKKGEVMKDYVWVVETLEFDEWIVNPWTATALRECARFSAQRLRSTGCKTRVRKYGRVGK